MPTHETHKFGWVWQVDVKFGEIGHRVSSVNMTISGVEDLSEKDREGLLSSAKHCTVKMSLETPPEIDIRLT